MGYVGAPASSFNLAAVPALLSTPRPCKPWLWGTVVGRGYRQQPEFYTNVCQGKPIKILRGACCLPVLDVWFSRL